MQLTFVVCSVVGCPDGGIGWEGVYVDGKCASWDSVTARLTQQICNDAKTVCTKMTTKHLHEMSKSAGVLMMKRVNCDADTGQCSVFKVAMHSAVWLRWIESHSPHLLLCPC